MNKDNCSIIIGQIGPVFGLKGEVKVRPFTDKPEQFDKLKEVCLVIDQTDVRKGTIEKVRAHRNYFIVKFAGINSVSDAEALRNAEIRVDKSELIPLSEHEYYIDELLGIDVTTTEGKALGKIKEVLRSPANDVYVTDLAMIPALKSIIISIDIQEKKMVVRPVEGLEI